MEVQLFIWINFLSQTQLSCYLLPFILLRGARLDVSFQEVVCQLEWDFLQCFLGQLELVATEFAERHELHNVAAHVPFVLIGIERRDIGIKLVHRREVGIAYTDNNDTERII